ncbi:MAG: helicase-exonuclease AddAB subunit AddA [Lachnospiraceae bacterium]|nr:helicase-exonuclease AddAB subunit AddA [Lachnospiraceae bacterium]
MEWTKDQKRVIDTRNKNILVSAAAGSGKTAVLVERIITMITDEKNPVSISNLLVVTFTNAAAAQMKERIIAAIEKKLLERPDDEYLKKQLILTNSAMITTIDSFLRYVFKNYFNEIDVSPALRIADESELAMIRNEAMEKAIEDYFNKKNDKFSNMVNMYSSSKNYDDFVDVVNKIYSMAVSQPYPKKWIRTLSEKYKNGNWEKEVVDNVRERVLDAKKDIIELENSIFENEIDRSVFGVYKDNFTDDKIIMDSILECRDINQLEKVFNNYKFSRLKSSKMISDEDKEMIKKARGKYKGYIDDIKKSYFATPLQFQRNIIDKLGDYIELLTDFVCHYYDRFCEMKVKKQIMDFSDLSRYALDILVDRETLEPTSVAKQLSDYYYEIMIDEYQDSNNIQELILTSISKKSQGINNIFMVGDVKQSIYRFRMARPELFIDKYSTYTSDGKENVRIDLHTNFRSREHILNFANIVFERIMKSCVGGIEYDELAALKCGAKYSKEKNTSSINEIIVYDKESVGDDLEESIEFEARIIASKIRQIIKEKKLIRDSSLGEEFLRPVEYGDIVILTRKQKGINEAFIDVFEQEGIPYEVNSTVGYFTAVEIKMILNVLRIINNPYQDVAITGVMLSPIFGFKEEEMIDIRSQYRQVCIYDAVSMVNAMDENFSGKFSYETVCKCKKLLDFINEYREIARYMKTEDVISKIVFETGLYDYIYAMPNGEKKRQNVDALVNKAAALDYSGLSGLFKFVATIEKMKKYELEFEPPAMATGENSVKLMTIHKSKGLEFPVVFLAGTYQQYNQADSKAKLCLDNDMGIGSIYVDYENRIKYDNIMARAVRNKIARDNIGEELRILYVALTRAKEQLYIVGGGYRILENIQSYYNLGMTSSRMGYNEIVSSDSNLKMILKALCKENVYVTFARDLLEGKHLECGLYRVCDNDRHLAITLVRELEEFIKEDEEIIKDKITIRDINNFDTNKDYSLETKEILEKSNEYVYPYNAECKCKSKVSVSDLKHAHIHANKGEVEDTEERFVFETDIRQSCIPKFIEKKEENVLTGAARGTVYHMVMKELDFTGDLSYDGIVAQMKVMSENGYIPENYMEIVSVKKIMEFFKTKEAKDMIRADKEGKLYKEKQFVMGLPLSQVYDIDVDELTIIQGIIDVYYEIDGKIYLLDYKTDNVDSTTGQQVLTQRYKLQLDYYKKAIEGGTSKKVERSIIYSFSMGKAFLV